MWSDSVAGNKFFIENLSRFSGPRKPESNQPVSPPYYVDGFLTTQNLVNQHYMQLLASGNSDVDLENYKIDVSYQETMEIDLGILVASNPANYISPKIGFGLANS